MTVKNNQPESAAHPQHKTRSQPIPTNNIFAQAVRHNIDLRPDRDWLAGIMTKREDV
ncbi:hypothetical protein [Lactiplantibacillus fabifermentans]|uniref:Uncharacterized protein n=2 Tax=Lactiplantibacillus fabifermentans TaxID=483011 RepID=A0A0R2NXR4_9LACO|nr:hypothetical protein [Lactiplantibacillus fabifermentans]ETY75069.1 hypothetical protein LFAB_03975 [Lactiplantibacillus fabifermentans T30PCM01]KRO29474.1 hypothetical protein DY78_GL000018 [Lactiplantibacillus fabifermentans DSM 21115]